MISNSLSTSEKYAALSEKAMGEFCQALYPLIVSHADDFGRLQGDPFTVRAKCYPASPRSLEAFKEALVHLDGVGLIVWYVVDGKRYIQIVNFERHQQGLHKRTRSMFPRVPGISGNDAEFPGQEKGIEEKRTEENGNSNTFARFWAIYPKKKAKDDALKAWNVRNPDAETVTLILAAVARQAQSMDWRKERGKFIPYPATWLRGGQWQDDDSELSSSASLACSRCGTVPRCTSFRECTDRVLAAAKAAKAS